MGYYAFEATMPRLFLAIKNLNCSSMTPGTLFHGADWQHSLKENSMQLSYKTDLPNLGGRMAAVTVWQKGESGLFHPVQLLQDPSGYRGRLEATHLVNFPAELFAGLKGKQPRDENDWSSEAMLRRRVVDWSVYHPQAAQISDELTALARSNQSPDNEDYNREYRTLIDQTFSFLELANNSLSPVEKKAMEKRSIVFLRAGAPATRATLGDEAYKAGKECGLVIPVGEKRGHLVGEAKGDVTLMMELQGISNEVLQSLDGAHLIICDPAFATGSSLMGFVMALESRGIHPASIELRAAAATRAGLDLMSGMLAHLQIDFKAHVLKIGQYLNERYYIGNDDAEDPKVGDAGDGLFGTQNQFDPDGDLSI